MWGPTIWPVFAFWLVSSTPSTKTSKPQRIPNRSKVLRQQEKQQKLSVLQEGALANSINDKPTTLDNSNDAPSLPKSILKVSVPTTDSILIWIDLENTRGKTGFQLHHWDLLDQTAQWAQHAKVNASVLVVADHGSFPSSYYCHELQLGLVFSGPGQKADDALVQGLREFSNQAKHHFVITADGELKCRCRRAVAPGSELHCIDPLFFLGELERFVDTSIREKERVELEEAMVLSEEEKQQIQQLDAEIDLRAQIIAAEVLLDRKTMSRKKRIKLQKTLRGLNAKLATLPVSLLDQLASTSNTAQHDRLLQRWNTIRSKSPRKEQTGDRVILAEQLRRQFSELESVINSSQQRETPIALSYIQFRHAKAINPTLQAPEPSTTKQVTKELDHPAPPAQKTIDVINNNETPLQLETLRIVAISDTHGFEQQFAEALPEGDLLLHLGDFAFEGTYRHAHKALQEFDQWLAQQPHRFKIILRGNHDPMQADFPRSGAYYVTEPTTLSFGDNLVLGAIPYGIRKNKNLESRLPKVCDILATHIPPHKVLDRTYTGRCVGSAFLSKAARSMKRPPRLWLCGHIHEGRGIAERSFGKDTTTIVINAANANTGRATHIEHGAAVMDVANQRNQPVNVVSMKDRAVSDRVAANTNLLNYQPSNSIDDGIQELLLAVDLGLKSGVSLYNDEGKLLRYEQFHFDKRTLVDTAIGILESWEASASLLLGHDRPPLTHKITHLAIEGGENYMLRAWAEAAGSRKLCLLKVSPEEWRAELLMDKERTSGANAKAASRLIARQVVMDFGVMPQHEGKFRTDVAESVCLGMYVARKIGWITGDIPVRRYGNGNVVVPKKT